jgi:hypothetical protein
MNEETKLPTTTDAVTEQDKGRCAPALGSASDAEWGRALWDWLREMLPDAGCCMEFDTDDLMKLAEKHGRSQRVKYDPHMHGGICDVDPGDEIWWWGDDLMQNDRGQACRPEPHNLKQTGESASPAPIG